MPAYPNHQDIRPFYRQSTDPGAVGAGVAWVDTTTGPPFQLKIRNNADNGWENIGLGAASGGDVNFVYDQSTPSATWNVTHNLGKFPSVTVYDTSDTEVEGAVVHNTTNDLTITFNTAFAGTAVLN